MLHRPLRALCAALLVLCAAWVQAQSKLLLIPTAHTLGAHRYQIGPQYKGPLFTGGDQFWQLKGKIGIGSRGEASFSNEIASGSSNSFLFNAKYAMPVAPHLQGCLGFENMGADARMRVFAVGTYSFPSATRLTAGIADDKGEGALLLGIDGYGGERFRWMADYKTSSGDTASLGGQYRFSDHWNSKGGFVLKDTGSVVLQLEVLYNGWY